jgi:hypothetical protein
MPEVRKARLATPKELIRRMAWSLLAGGTLIVLSLLIGIVGYHWLGELSWIDAFVDASMILSGMGPVSPLHGNAVKLFAGCYALYCGITLIAATGVIIAPLIHRAMHKFHLEDLAGS